MGFGFLDIGGLAGDFDDRSRVALGRLFGDVDIHVELGFKVSSGFTAATDQ